MNDEEMDLALQEYAERWRTVQPRPAVDVPDAAARRWPVMISAAAAVVLVAVGGAAAVRLGDPVDTPADPAAPTSRAVTAPQSGGAPSVSASSAPEPAPRVIAVVPWRPDPIASPERPPGRSESSKGLEPCAPEELRMEARFAVPPELVGVTVSGILTMTNMSDQRCVVHDKLTWRPAGAPREPGQSWDTLESGSDAVLAPGEVAVSHLTWGYQRCEDDFDLSTLVIDRLGRATDVRVPAVGLVRSSACSTRPARTSDGMGGPVQATGAYGRGDWVVKATGAPERLLAATLEAPEAVRNGEVLEVRATLTNPTDHEVVLDACPVVTITLAVSHEHQPHEWHRLDCAAVRTIPPAASVQFEVKVATAGRGVVLAEDPFVVVGLRGQHKDVRIVAADAATPSAQTTSTPSAAPTAHPVADVPWQPDPVPASEPTPAVVESAPACADETLEMTAYFAPPTTQQRGPVGGVLEIRNAGERICRVQSKFSFLPTGAEMPDGAGVTDELGPPAILAPGDLAVSTLSWWGAECNGPKDLERIDLIPHSNDGLEKRDIQAIGLQRGACPRPFGDVGSGSWAVAVTRQPERDVLRLVAVLDAPASVRRGEPLRFSVTLTNVTPEPVALDPAACPVVEFGLGGATERHRLRCRSHYAFAPGASVRYHFEVTPTDAPPTDGPKGPGDGTSALTWQLADSPFGTTSLPVRIE